jgi:chaperonin GroES
MNNYMPAEPGEMDEASPQDTESPTSLRVLVESKNLAEGMDEEELKELTEQVTSGFEYDLQSREHWEDNLTEWTNLALQAKVHKTWPWDGASNVKYPLLSIASMQFNARAYPSLVPATGDVVKCEVIGTDADGQKLERSKRVSKFMSYQLMNEMDGWEEDMDKLLIMLPIVGTLFKKTYYDSVLKHNVSELVLPKNVVVNYWAKGLDTAERISEIVLLNKRELKERQLSKTYLDIDLGEPTVWSEKDTNGFARQDETMPYQIIEQHTYFDMDDDGYAEPYVVTFERSTKKVLRIVARYDESSIYTNEDGSLQKISPIQYYTKFSFIPNPDGGFYDIGFGLLLGPLNESVNTLINQLIDAGTLSNLQGGFLGKGMKLKMGGQQWQPGEWKTVQTTADDLRKQVMPLPTKEPSNVLFELMGTLISGAKELASVAEIFVGKMPGQNTPATTTMATIEQGMKVFTAVYKRIYRSLKSEYKKIFRLNNIYLKPENYANILDEQVTLDDFDEKRYDICPNADPSTPTQTEKLMKAQALLELLQVPGILDPVQVVKRVLEAQEQPNIQQLFTPAVQQTGQTPPPPPDPKLLAIQEKSKAEQQHAEVEKEKAIFDSQMQQRDMQFKQAMEAQQQNHDMQIKEMSARLDGVITLHKEQALMAQAAAQHQQDMQHGQQQHEQDMQHGKEQAALKNQQMRNASKSGSKTK